MKKLKSLGLSFAVISAFSLGFNGCGSSDGGSRDSGTKGDISSKSLSGNVADGYLIGATVCLDKNSNAKCDTNEPNTKTTKNKFLTIFKHTHIINYTYIYPVVIFSV